MRIVLISIAVATFCVQSWAQSPLVPGFVDGRQVIHPHALLDGAVDTIPFASLPIDQLRQEAIETFKQGHALPFAVNRDDQAFSPRDSGTVIDLGNGRLAWRLRIESENAYSINLGTRFDVPGGTRIYLLDGKGTTVYRALTSADNNWSGEFWTPIVPGPVMEVYAEVDAAEWQAFEEGFAIFTVNLAFSDLSGSFADEREDGERSASCMIDVNCPQGDPWTTQINGVARITIGGSGLCSGGMINNTAQDGIPYFMTANHCGPHNNPAGTVAYWNYQNSFCRTPGSSQSGQSGNGSLSQFSSGMQLRMTYQPADFTLLRLNTTPPSSWNITYLGWDRTTTGFTNGIAIHHPQGDEKRISFANSAPGTANISIGGPNIATWTFNFSGGPGLQGGSSGSPGFDQNGRVRGTATAVNSLNVGVVCNTQTGFYGRFNVAWTGGGSSSTRLSDWLDPLGTGQTSLDHLGSEPPPVPGPFSLLSPADGTNNIDPSAFNTFTWTASENAFKYVVAISTTPSFSPGTFVVGPIDRTSPNLTVFSGTFEEDTTYYWRVTAENSVGDSVASSPTTASFSTLDLTPPPGCVGDIDGDGFTDLNDFAILALNFGSGPGATSQDGDLNGDGFVDLDDFAILAVDFGCLP